MIVLDEEDQQKLKDSPAQGPTLRYPERAAGRRPFSPLPDYETSQAQAFRRFNESLVSLHKPAPKRRFFDSKFWRAALSALIVYIILSIVIAVPVLVTQTRDGSGPISDPYSSLSYAVPWQDHNTTPSWSSPPNIITAVENGATPICNAWSNAFWIEGPGLFQASTQLNVSANGQFSIASNTSYIQDFDSVIGNLNVDINPDPTVNQANLGLTMQASSFQLHNDTLVCFAVTHNSTDLFIYIPSQLTANDTLQFNVTLLFPQSSTPANVDVLSTYLPLFWQKFGDFGNYVDFNQVSIEGGASKVTVQSLHAQQVLVDTSLQPISGEFHINNTATLGTIQAPIDVNITLYNDPKASMPTYLGMNTGNANLTANITVYSPLKTPTTRPNFITYLRTFSGDLSAQMLHDPQSPPTGIRFTAINDLAPTNVTLDRKYTGMFQATTRLSNTNVVQGPAWSDPWSFDAPLTRTYDIMYNTTERVYGWVGWGSLPTEYDPTQVGEVIVSTSMDDVSLSFG
ncbi:hypothetical protein CONPUDRAFT_121541 [Coniophora puteana RWD-64-598 SS2]|uniref:Uncharacterized protein n=1 Tax=Coniophora puteana (strain RWD-64-598) TaxID=741705 RepID=A0A5M3MVF1_CONPW|nr:uncharacterized protein CONPUDRAFT_121541 [Coniophora puteana RWD-64-598 SS2]EIW83129.1 hypothetical protein CONPUDRAFT_121541 [Coniophora puteana RWD-64-598 SS2]